MSKQSEHHFWYAKNEQPEKAIKMIAEGLFELSKEISEIKQSIEQIRQDFKTKS
jgi:hypothetical protein